MAAFQRILQLIVLSGFALPGLPLSSSSSATPLWNPHRLHLTDQKQSEFQRNPEREVIGGEAEAERLEFDGERGEGHPGEGRSHHNTERGPSVEPVGHQRLLEGSKGQRWVKGQSGRNDATGWGKTADVATDLLRKDTSDDDTRRPEVEKEKRKWDDNNMRVWGKRTASEREEKDWGEDSIRTWDEKASTAAGKRKWGDNSMSVWGKRSQDGNDKRKWGDNSMSVWGKRSNGEKGASDIPSTSGEAKEKTDLAKDPGSSQGPRILHKRSISDREENLNDRPRYDWLVQELSKRSRPQLNRYGRQYGGPKRNWETNTMKVWGKRGLVWNAVPNWDDYLDEDSKDEGKRSWTSDNAIRVWGKRNRQLEANEIMGLPMYDQ